MFFKTKVLCRVELSRLSCLPFSDPSLDQEFGGQKLIEALMWVFVASTYSAAACCGCVTPVNCHINIANRRTPATPTHLGSIASRWEQSLVPGSSTTALCIFVSPLPVMVKYSYLYFRLSAIAWTSIMVTDLLPLLACLLKEILKAITILSS